jgi:signal transduction histidine kinase
MRGDLGRSRYHAPTAALVLTSLLVALGMTAPPVLLGLYAGARRRLVESLRERADGLQRELSLLAERAAESAERARMQERTRIARDMHDVVAHRVSLMVVHASALQAVATRDPEQAARSAGLLGDLGRQALDELRQMLGVLRTGPGPGSGAGSGSGAARSDEAVPAQRPAPGSEYDGRAGAGLTRIAEGALVGERAVGAVAGAGGAEGGGAAGAVGVVPAASVGAVRGGGDADGDGVARSTADAGSDAGSGSGSVPGAAPEAVSGTAAPDGAAADPGSPGPDAAGPCLDELDALVAASRAAGMDVELTVEGARRPCHPGVEAAVYRVVQEALTNAHKHAPGAGTRVTLAFRADEVAVQIRNGPSGGAPTVRLPSGGNGLLGMRERVTALGGGFASGPTPEGGFRVSALLPSPSRSAAAG